MKLHTSVLLLIFAWGCKPSSHIIARNNFNELWKLQRVEKRDTSGQWREIKLMKGGTGYIIYDGQGYMAVQLLPAGYKDFN